MAGLLEFLFDDAPKTAAERMREQSLARAAALRGQPPGGAPMSMQQAEAALQAMPQDNDAFAPIQMPTAPAQMPRPPAQAAPGGPALPRAMGGQPQGPAAAPGPVPAPVDPAQARLDSLQAQMEGMGPVDRSGTEAMFKRNQEQGGQGLLLALAAQEAGNQPIAGHYLQKARAAGEPIKTAGGTMTEGGFIEDVDYARQREESKLQGQIAQQQAILNSNATREEKQRAEKASQAFQMEMARMNNAAAMGRAQVAASGSAATAARPTAAAAKALMDASKSQRMVNDAVAAFEANPDAFGAQNYLGDAVTQRLDPKGVAARAAVANLGSLVIHDRSGAAVSASEFPRLQPFIPAATDSPETVRVKLARFKKEYDATVAELGGEPAAAPADVAPSATPTAPAAPAGGGGFTIKKIN